MCKIFIWKIYKPLLRETKETLWTSLMGRNTQSLYFKRKKKSTLNHWQVCGKYTNMHIYRKSPSFRQARRIIAGELWGEEKANTNLSHLLPSSHPLSK